MASLRFETNGKREGWRIQFYGSDKRKKSIWLGGLTKRQAETWQIHVENLLNARGSGSAMKPSSAAWVGELDKEHRNKLVQAGLIDPLEPETKADPTPTLADFCKRFIDSKRSAKESTVTKFEQVRDALIRHFGADRRIDSITAADADTWREWLATEGNIREGKERKDRNGKTIRGRTDLADNTVRRRTGIAKQFFAWAIKAKLISENPFNGLACSVHANEARQFFVSREQAYQAIDKAPNAEWRAVIALSRFGGLRCPSEPMRLKWEDVDLVNRRLRIHAKKTEHHRNGGVRYCPIFPELMPYLEDLAKLAQERNAKPADYVLIEARGSEAYYRTGLYRILNKAGIAPWPKLFQNMRASRETELLADFPVKDVCSWIGNTQAVAMKHYAMVMDSSFAKASGLDSGGSIGGSILDKNSENPIEPRGSIPASHKLSETPFYDEKPLVFLGVSRDFPEETGERKWAVLDSNQRPQRCQRCALTN
jgi:integrase